MKSGLSVTTLTIWRMRSWSCATPAEGAASSEVVTLADRRGRNGLHGRGGPAAGAGQPSAAADGAWHVAAVGGTGAPPAARGGRPALCRRRPGDRRLDR